VTGQKGHSDPNQQRIPLTTTDAGIGAASDDHSLTVGADGPILLQDH
jgi:catalase